jgi:hypothetical protein
VTFDRRDKSGDRVREARTSCDTAQSGSSGGPSVPGCSSNGSVLVPCLDETQVPVVDPLRDPRHIGATEHAEDDLEARSLDEFG